MICHQLTVDRVQDGKPASKPLLVAYDPPTGQLLLWQEFRPTKNTWADRATYLVEEFEAESGRAFFLHRAASDIEADPQRVDRYACLLADRPADDICDCRGQYGSERRGQFCKHRDGLRGLLSNGHLRKREMFGGVGA